MKIKIINYKYNLFYHRIFKLYVNKELRRNIVEILVLII